MTSKKSQRSPATWWAEWRENFSIESVGLVIFLVGGFFLISLLPSNDPFAHGPPWLAGMMGWVAPLAALTMLSLGALLMLGERIGYWGVEAIVGAELLLLALQMGTFAWNNAEPNWAPQFDGANGGLVGTTLGSLLVAGLGQWPAFAVIVLVGAIGIFWVVGYTPLYYLYWRLLHSLPLVTKTMLAWRAYGDYFRRARSRTEEPAAIPAAANFVPAHEPVVSHPNSLPVDDAVEPQAPAISVEPAPAAAKQAARRSRTVNTAAESIQTPHGSGQLPPLDLLGSEQSSDQPLNVQALQQLIEDTLADFSVPVRTVHVESGPTVTQFGVAPLYLERGGQRRKVRVSRIVNLADDLALALAVPAVRIEAPVPGRPYVGIEVPNPEKKIVSLRGIMESKTFQQPSGIMKLPLGRNTAGAPVIIDLTRAPHILIAGATGAGKSVCINTIVTGLLMQHPPERLRFVMVDPKMVELPGYNGIPHLLGNVITDVEQVMGSLTWLLLQMDDRYRLFQQAGVRNIDAYNASLAKNKRAASPREPLPYIVLIIDELADLMMTAADDVERQVCRLAQMARATGIHLILATQRPSVDVVTGLIKANFPSRIAFAVTSQTDSRVILDTPGAERLLGRGDMLVMRPDLAKLQRVQGCFVADDEISRVVKFWQDQSAAGEAAPTPPPWAALMDRLEDEDELLQEAIDAVRDLKQVNTSLLQRKLRIGYPKAVRLIEQLAAKGIVGPDQGAGQGREVLLKSENDDEETLFEAENQSR